MKTGRIFFGELILDGMENMSVLFRTIFRENGFKNPLFVTNEEIEGRNSCSL